MKDFDDFADLIENQYLDTPQPFLASSILFEENMFEPIAKLADLEKEEIAKRVANLGMDDISDLIDAVNANDEAKVLMILNYGKNVGEDDDHEDDAHTVDVEDEADDEDSVDADRAPDSQHGLLGPDETLEEAISVGQEVKIGKHKEGVVKVADGPGNTAGVLIDGEMQMVDKKKIARVDEAVLGMTAMPGLKRMQELAGIATGAAPAITVTDTTPTVAADAAAEVEGAVQALDLPNSEEAAVVGGDAEAVEKVEDDVEAEVASDEAEQADETADASDEDCEGEDCADDEAEGADRPHEVNPQVDPEAEITAALEVIERNIRNVKVGAFKTINDRIQAIQGSLFESAVIRRKPL